ncbi:uncharacterized protein LOC115631844 [Scaptodrosophila lebanonensis]|uniref:Uncharacterized protein LOC115631844 n=1 Tax=Drosophila lebanonensis TaxID=7225 RepID=A0A6J2UBH0_DROLE|nr:uncharacterized protein LOC115631844 [Scaptodrosophila lebanonensis]
MKTSNVYIVAIGITVLAVIIKGSTGENNDDSESIEWDQAASIIDSSRQLFLGKGKETSTPNFARLVIMRLIYGIASTMGIEDRLEDVFNGAFVPPGADDGIGIGLGDLEDNGNDGILGGIFEGDDIL